MGPAIFRTGIFAHHGPSDIVGTEPTFLTERRPAVGPLNRSFFCPYAGQVPSVLVGAAPTSFRVQPVIIGLREIKFSIIFLQNFEESMVFSIRFSTRKIINLPKLREVLKRTNELEGKKLGRDSKLKLEKSALK
jgi:hypothetical protein